VATSNRFQVAKLTKMEMTNSHMAFGGLVIIWPNLMGPNFFFVKAK
jgi:hypothetical protein